MSENVPDMHAGDPLSAWEARTKEIVREVLREEGMTIPLHVREANHQFVAECKEELQAFLLAQRRRRERWEKVRDTAVGTLVVTAISSVIGLLAWIGQLVLQALTHPVAADAAQHIDKLPPR